MRMWILEWRFTVKLRRASMAAWTSAAGRRQTLVYATPVIIEQPPPHVVVAEPLYLHVPPEHARDWGLHCHEYHACNRQVYFVKSREYEPAYIRAHEHERQEALRREQLRHEEHVVREEEHEARREERHEEHERHDHDHDRNHDDDHDHH